MRLRLIFSFILIVFITIASLLLVVRLNTEEAVHAFMFHGGMAGVEELVAALETHYETHRSWHNAENVFRQYDMMGEGKGRNGEAAWGHRRLRLLDAEGNVLLDSRGGPASGKVDAEAQQRASPLIVEGETVGYLLPEGPPAVAPGSEAGLL